MALKTAKEYLESLRLAMGKAQLELGVLMAKW